MITGWKLVGFAAAAVILGSCATYLKVSKVTDTSRPLIGYPYHLKFTQFDIVITRRIVGCSNDSSNRLRLKLDTKVDFTPKTALDPSQFYVIDPRSLANGFKTADASFEWNSDLTLKSAGTTVDDQTAAVAANLIAAAGKIVPLAMAAGAPLRGDACAPFKEKIEAVNRLKQAVDVATAQLDDAVQKLKRVTDKAALMGIAVDRKTKAALSRAIDAVALRTEALAAKQAALEKALAAVSIVAKLTWPENGDEWASAKPATLSAADVKKLQLNTATIDKSWQMPVYFRLVAARAASGGGGETEWRGLPYREPAAATIDACSDPDCKEKLASMHTMVLQGGPMFVLPFETPALGSTKAAAGFDASGALKTAGYAQTKAPAEVASGILNSAAAQASTVVASAAEARTKALQVKAQELQAQVAYRQAEADQGNADKALAVKSYSADAALAKAELSALQAQQELAAARAKLSGQP